ASEGVKITEAELGGDINDIVWHTPTHAYALVGNGSVNRLVVWNPTTGLKTATPFTANGGFSPPDMGMNDRGELYVCKNPNPATTVDRPGLLVFSTSTDALLAGPLDTGLPPIAVIFDRATDAVLSVPDAPATSALALRGPRPNPAHGSAPITLAVAQASSVEVSVMDAAGRRVRALARATLGEGEHPIVWNLEDEAGRAVGAGLYFVRARAGEATVKRTIVVVR